MKTRRSFAYHPLRRAALWLAPLVAAACTPEHPSPDVTLARDTGADTLTGTPGITLSPTSGLRTSESGTAATFAVVLDAQPTADVSIALSSSNAGEGTVAPQRVTFTALNWNAPQTVTVTGVDDQAADGDRAYTVVTAAAQSADPRYDGMDAPDVQVTNTDNDVAGVTVTPPGGLRVSEAGTSAQFGIVLNTAPTAPVTFALASSNPAEATVYPASVTFTPSNWSAAQSVRVTGVDDTVADGDQALTVVISPATSTDGRYSGLDPQDVSVTNVDNDGPGITVAPALGLRTTEAGATATFGVVLNSQPTADVTIALASSNTAEGTVAPAALRFTALNWNAPQVVTVTGVDDPIADGNQAYAVRTAPAVSADARYNGLDADDVALSNIDDETPGVTLAPTNGLVVSESGATASFGVALNSMPTGSVTIALASSRPGEGTVSPASLTFTATNWRAPQTVTVTGVDDRIADGNQAFAVVTSPCVSSDPGYDGLDAPDVSLTNTDNDSPGITLRAAPMLTTSESGLAATFGLLLNSQPTGNVTIALASSRPGEGAVSPASVTFTPINWSAPQTVTVRGVDDHIADGNQVYAVLTAAAVSTDPGYNGLDADDVAVLNTDNDSPGVIVVPTAMVVSESGTTSTLTVSLASQPTANVTIELRSSNPGEGTVSPTVLTFTPTNYAAPQTATVRGVDDHIADGDQRFTVQLLPTASNDTGYSGIDPADVSVVNIDDDSPGISVAPTSGLRTSESGGRAVFTVVLNSQPTATVLIPLRSTNTLEGIVQAAPLAFTAANWNSPQSVVVTGLDDDGILDGDQMYRVVLGAATSSDVSYNGLVGAGVDLVNTDNDAPGITVAAGASLRTTESGGTAAFTLALNARPRADVTIALASASPLEGTVTPASVTFTVDNWNAPQLVTVRGVDDDVQDGNQVFAVLTLPAVSTDPGYAGLDPADVSVTNVDDDSAGVSVLPTSGLHTTEAGGAAVYNVTLSSRPTADVVLTLTSSDPAEGRVLVPVPLVPGGSAVLTIHPSDWNAVHPVLVGGVDDSLVDGDQPWRVTATVASADPNYAALTVPDVSVTNDDDDTAGIRVVPGNTATLGNELHTGEKGETSTFTVELTASPAAGNVVVLALESTDPLEGTVSPSTITFDRSNWNVPVVVTATGVDDSIADGNQPWAVAVTVDTTPGRTTEPTYAALSIKPTVFLINDDDDSAGVVVTPAGAPGSELLTSESGGAASFTVQLGSQPRGDVLVTLTSSRPTEALLSAGAPPAPIATLLFTAGAAGTWATPQTVTLTGQDDAPPQADLNQPLHISVTTASAGDPAYQGRAVPDVNVINTDNDTPQVFFDLPVGTSTYTTSESNAASGAVAGSWFRVRLATQPVSAVTVNLTTSNAGEAVLCASTAPGAPVLGSVTFPAGTTDWNDGIVVFVRGADDSPAVVDGAQGFTITPSVAAGSDPAYLAPGVALPMPLAGVNQDNDSPGFTVTDVSGGFATSEGAGVATFNLRLNVQPAGTVTVALASDNPGEGTVAPAALTFTVGTGTASDWDQDHLVTVTGVDDAIVDGAVDYNVLLSATGGGYMNGANPFTLNVPMSNADNDVAALVLLPASLITTESAGPNHAQTLHVQLAVQPTATVSVTITGADPAQGTLSTSALTFTATPGPNAWNVDHPVQVTSVDDAVRDTDQSYTLTLSAAGGGYNGVTDTVLVTDLDDDLPPTIALSPTGGTFVGDSAPVGLQNPGAHINNPGGALISQLVVTMTSGDAADVLSLPGLPATLQYMVTGAGTGTVTLTVSPAPAATPTTGDYDLALQALTFHNTDPAVATGVRGFTFEATNAIGSTPAPLPSYLLNVTHLNAAPSALGPATAACDQDTFVAITLSATDAEGNLPLTYDIVTPPAHGAFTGSAPNLTYIPAPGYVGPDSFTFTATDGLGAVSLPASVSITVNAVGPVCLLPNTPCGSSCCTPTETCSGGTVCVPSCAGIQCGAACCVGGDRCVSGSFCAPPCLGGTTECGASCCSSGDSCVGGVCVPPSCTSSGGSCSADGECCSGFCLGICL